MSDKNIFHSLKEEGVVCKCDENIENEYFEKVFQITLNPNKVNEGFYLLKRLDLEKLSLANIDDAMMERLGAYEKIVFNRIQYLNECYLRHNKLIESQSEALSIDDSKTKETVELIIRYAITYVIEPEIFNSNSSGHEIFLLIIDSLCNHFSFIFLDLIRSKLKADEYVSFYNPVLYIILNKLKLFRCLITDPDYIEVVDVLNYFSSEESTAKVLANSSAFLPPSDVKKYTIEMITTQTVFGLTLYAICSHAFLSRSSVYFDVTTLSFSNIRDIILSIRTSLDHIYNKMIETVKRFLAHAELRNSAYIWFHSCLDAHVNRLKLANSIFALEGPNTPGGFFINLTYVALRIMSPISRDYDKLLSRVDIDYCQYDHEFTDSVNRNFVLSYKNETMLVPSEREIPCIPKSFNFGSHWFFFCLRVVRIGLMPTLEQYLEFTTEAQRLKDMEEDGESVTELGNIREEQLCLQTQICNPSVLDLVIEFCAAVSVFLLNAVGIRFTDGSVDYSRVRFNTDKLTNIPEYFLEDLTNVIMSVVQLNAVILEKSSDHFVPIILCLSFFMGYKECVFNPHLRANIAKAIVILTYNVPEAPTPNYRQIRLIFETSRSISCILPKSLIKLFVDIEFTGHANEFQQKFSYRFQMYQILFFIWQFDDYKLMFTHMSIVASEVLVKDKLPIYLRFINLLINDATYLLDESLTRLLRIHDLEHEISQPSFLELDREKQKEKKAELKETRKIVEGYNLLASNTIDAIKLLTAQTPKPFLTSFMVDRIAAMLNIFLLKLVGKEKQNLKVLNMSELKFEPRELVVVICQIYINLCESDQFIHAVILDERSFNIELPNLAYSVLQHINADSMLISQFDQFRCKIRDKFDHVQDENIDISEIPDEYLDPISFTLMYDPVMLPASNMIVDRTTITKHLLSDEIDPYTRSKLTISMLIPQTELKSRIQDWLKTRKNK